MQREVVETTENGARGRAGNCNSHRGRPILYQVTFQVRRDPATRRFLTPSLTSDQVLAVVSRFCRATWQTWELCRQVWQVERGDWRRFSSRRGNERHEEKAKQIFACWLDWRLTETCERRHGCHPANCPSSREKWKHGDRVRARDTGRPNRITSIREERERILSRLVRLHRCLAGCFDVNGALNSLHTATRLSPLLSRACLSLSRWDSSPSSEAPIKRANLVDEKAAGSCKIYARNKYAET